MPALETLSRTCGAHFSYCSFFDGLDSESLGDSGTAKPSQLAP